MFLLKWYREFIEIRYEREAKKKELQFCQACETLKMQLAIANDERRLLINKLTDKPEAIEEKQSLDNLRPIQPPRMSWNVRRQHLESESREAAKRLHKNNEANSGKALTVNEIEKELGVEEIAK